jgi:hypothetical protein
VPDGSQDDTDPSGARSINFGFIFLREINMREIYIPAIFVQVVRIQTLSISSDTRTVTGFFLLNWPPSGVTLYYDNNIFVSV